MHLRFLGGLTSIGASCLLLEDQEQALLIDAGAALGAGGYVFPDFSSLLHLGKKLRAVFITHAHFDHAGAAAALHDLFPGIAFLASRETLAFLHGRYGLPKTASTRIVMADEEIAQGNWLLTPLAVRHSIPGAFALHVAAPSGKLLISGDFRSFADPARLSDFSSPDIFICESTNAAIPNASASEEEVQGTIAALIAQSRLCPERREARNASEEGTGGRVVFTCFSSNLARIRAALAAARGLGMDVFVDGEALRNALALARALEPDPLWGPYSVPPSALAHSEWAAPPSALAHSEWAAPPSALAHSEGAAPPRVASADSALPSSCLILVTGSQGEEGSRLLSIVKKGFLARREDALILSASPIPGNEDDWRLLLDTVAREPAELYLPPHTRTHASGHACRDELAAVLEHVKPRLVLPVHGQYYQRRCLADLARDMGYGSKILEDQDYLSLDGGAASFHHAAEQGRSAEPFLAGAGERRQLARFGIAFIVLICSSEARQVRAHITVRGFFRNESNADFLAESSQSLEAEVLELWSRGIFSRTRIRQGIQREMQKRFTEHFGLCPLLSVLYHEL